MHKDTVPQDTVIPLELTAREIGLITLAIQQAFEINKEFMRYEADFFAVANKFEEGLNNVQLLQPAF